MANEINGTALQVYQQLLTLGVAPGTAAGAVGSLMGESGKGLNTAALNRGDGADGSDSIGMGQWNQSRATALRRTAEQMGTSWTDSRAQVAHIGNELQGSHKHVLKALLAAGDDVGAGNDIWTRQYEVPADAGTQSRIRLSHGVNFARQIGAATPEQLSAILARAPTVPAAPASRGSSGGNSVRDLVTSDGNFGMPASPLAGMISLGGFGEKQEDSKPVAQLASADKSQADALSMRALGGVLPQAPAAAAMPQQAAPAPSPVAVAGVIGTTPGSSGNPFGALATPVQNAAPAPAAPAQAAPAGNDTANPFGAVATPVQHASPSAAPAAAAKPPEFKFNDKAEAPASLRFEIDALSKPQDQLTALRKYHPEAQPYDGDNFIYKNDMGEWQKYNNKGWMPSLGDIAGAAPMLAEMIGGGVGAIGGAALGNVPGAVAGAAAGGTAGREAAQRGINWFYGNTDTRTGGEQLQDAAITAGANAVGEGAGQALGAGLRAAGRSLGFGTQAAKEAATDMRAIGLEPTVGMVTGNAPTQYMERGVGAVPVLGGNINKAGQKAADAMAAENDRIVSGIASSTNPNAVPGTAQEVGGMLKQGAEDAQKRFFDGAEQQYSNVGALTGSTPVQGSHIANLGRELVDESKNITQFGRETHGSELNAAMRRVRALGEDVANGASFDTLKQARTQVGTMLRDSTNKAEQGYLGRMYEALTAEMGATADSAGNGARAAWENADAAYKAGMAKGSPANVKENLAPVLRAQVDEDVLSNMLRGSEKGGNRIASARRQIVQGQGNEAWDQFAAATVQRMGNPKGDGFSSTTFLKNWNAMSTEAKAALFDGTANEAYRADLDRLARIAGNMRNYGKSVNGSNTSNIETIKAGLAGIGAIGGAAMTGKAALALGHTATGGVTLAATKVADSLLTNPTVVSLVAGLPKAQMQRGGVQNTVNSLLAHAALPTVQAAQREAITTLARNIENAYFKGDKNKK
ncbi:phage tail tip lysozyme [Methylobacterium fujisawaense]|uniref:phage tail tip lysozyme n=1 Tax=Methylobacterium fujisawaense TaxID=107400 RepID=UPI003CF58F79